MKKETVKVIKKLKNTGQPSIEISKDLGLSLDYIEQAFEIIEADKKLKTSRVQIGHFTSILEKKKEQHAHLLGTEKMLVMNVRSLWGMVSMLEKKRKYLDEVIEKMEQYIKKGSKVADVFIEHGIELEN